MSVKLLVEQFEVSKFKRRLQRLVRIYTCQNATLLEITCYGSDDNICHMSLYHYTISTSMSFIYTDQH